MRAALAALALLAGQSWIDRPPDPSWRTGAAGVWAATRELETDGTPVFVYFRTDWCGVCKQMEAGSLSSPKVIEYMRGFAKVSVNPEKGREEKKLAEEYGVRGYPSMFVILP